MVNWYICNTFITTHSLMWWMSIPKAPWHPSTSPTISDTLVLYIEWSTTYYIGLKEVKETKRTYLSWDDRYMDTIGLSMLFMKRAWYTRADGPDFDGPDFDAVPRSHCVVEEWATWQDDRWRGTYAGISTKNIYVAPSVLRQSIWFQKCLWSRSILCHAWRQ